MSYLIFWIVGFALSIALIPFVSLGKKGWITGILFACVFVFSVIPALKALAGHTAQIVFAGNFITGPIRLVVDGLSGWFIVLINFVFLTGFLYGFHYLKPYKNRSNALSLHAIAFLLAHISLLLVCVLQNSFVFLIAWELMALSFFVLVIFEHEKMKVVQAGMHFLIQSHLSILFLMFGFIWVAIKTGSFDFIAITQFTSTHQGMTSLFLFGIFFVGFAIKSGLVPFHTWLPYAHPAAPSHVSGIMSGVLIKIGIFGMLRLLSLIRTDYQVLGYFILFFSVFSALYGVMLAIVQHDLKRLLAYHSIENIGIIGMGLGIGCIGLGLENVMLTILGFSGALLHTLNHALFKSLLFYLAGAVYHSTHSMNMDHLGGLIRKMPRTAGLFLLASIAICGIPPLNGFVSEFLIYQGFFEWMHEASLTSLLVIVFSILGLVLTGGLALFCFSKAFSVVFLGTPRSEMPENIQEMPFYALVPLLGIALMIGGIGLFPASFFSWLREPLASLLPTGFAFPDQAFHQGLGFLHPLTRIALTFGVVLLGLLGVRFLFLRRRRVTFSSTWGCGYTGPSGKFQYTSGSFARTYSKLFSFAFFQAKKEKKIDRLFPVEGLYETHTHDKIEYHLIQAIIKVGKSLIGRFGFLQNGKLQFYILYGILFILSVICLPYVYERIVLFSEFLKQI